jgi:hypothetical protein
MKNNFWGIRKKSYFLVPTYLFFAFATWRVNSNYGGNSSKLGFLKLNEIFILVLNALT